MYIHSIDLLICVDVFFVLERNCSIDNYNAVNSRTWFVEIQANFINKAVSQASLWAKTWKWEHEKTSLLKNKKALRVRRTTSLTITTRQLSYKLKTANNYKIFENWVSNRGHRNLNLGTFTSPQATNANKAIDATQPYIKNCCPSLCRDREKAQIRPAKAGPRPRTRDAVACPKPFTWPNSLGSGDALTWLTSVSSNQTLQTGCMLIRLSIIPTFTHIVEHEILFPFYWCSGHKETCSMMMPHVLALLCLSVTRDPACILEVNIPW
jgi:hypothetical protein